MEGSYIWVHTVIHLSQNQLFYWALCFQESVIHVLSSDNAFKFKEKNTAFFVLPQCVVHFTVTSKSEKTITLKCTSSWFTHSHRHNYNDAFTIQVFGDVMLYSTQDRGIKFLWNIQLYLHNSVKSHPRRLRSWVTAMRASNLTEQNIITYITASLNEPVHLLQLHYHLTSQLATQNDISLITYLADVPIPHLQGW